jgi:hypothetical protein
MTSSISLKKIVSIGAAMLLAVGGNLVASEPAFAATSITWDAGTGGTMSSNSQQTLTESVTTGNTIASAQVATKPGCTFVQWQEWRGGIMFSNVSFPYTPYGASLDLRARWECPDVLTTAPTIALSGSTVTATTGVWAVGSPTGEWLICGQSVSASSNMNGYFNPSAFACENLHSLSVGQSRVSTNPLNLSNTYYRFGGSSNTVANLAGSKLVWIERGTGSVSSYAVTASVSIPMVISGSSSQNNSTPVLSAEQARNMLKPVPAAVQPLVPAFLALNKPMASLGGSVALSAGDFTGLVSAKIANKSIDFILGKTGQITMTVPQGEAGKTADLVLTFNTGSIILQDAIKYVAPVVVADVPVRPVAIKAGAKSISESAADEIRHAALANLKNDTIQCVAYSASNSAAAKAAAQLTAVQACGVAVKANPELKVADVEVIIDKLKARTQGVGIKVYKANN